MSACAYLHLDFPFPVYNTSSMQRHLVLSPALSSTQDSDWQKRWWEICWVSEWMKQWLFWYMEGEVNILQEKEMGNGVQATFTEKGDQVKETCGWMFQWQEWNADKVLTCSVVTAEEPGSLWSFLSFWWVISWSRKDLSSPFQGWSWHTRLTLGMRAWPFPACSCYGGFGKPLLARAAPSKELDHEATPLRACRATLNGTRNGLWLPREKHANKEWVSFFSFLD